MTATSKNAPTIVDHLSSLVATISSWIQRLEGMGNVPLHQAKLEQSVASPLQTPASPSPKSASPLKTSASPSHTTDSPSQTQPVKMRYFTQSLRPIGDVKVHLSDGDSCIVKESSSNFFTSKTEDCGQAVAPSSAQADLRPSQSTSITGQLLSPLPPNSSPMATPRQSSFTDQNPRKRKASLVTRACSTPNLRSQSVEVYFDGATLKTLENLVKDLTKSAGGIYRHLRIAKTHSRMNAMALEVDNEDDGCENGDAEEEKDEHLVVKLHFVSTRRMRPSYDQTALLASQPSTFGDLKKGLADCENQCDKAAHSLLKYGDCSSEIGDIRSKLEELKEMAEKEIEMLSVK